MTHRPLSIDPPPASATSWPRDLQDASQREKRTTIWLTAAFDDKGIKEVLAVGHLSDAHLSTLEGTDKRCGYSGYREGDFWHRTKEAAVARAHELRRQRIDKQRSELARLLALPPIEESTP